MSVAIEQSKLNTRSYNYPQIRNIFLITTHKCNLACRYCFVSQNPSEMPLEVALDAIDYLVANNDLTTESGSVCFFGGEPLLRWDDLIVPTVLYKERVYPDLKLTFSITSNCSLLNDERIQFIVDHNIGLLTSIDGAKETQDYNRPFHNGKGSFDIVSKNIEKLIAKGRNGTFRSTIYPPTCGNVYENYLYAISLGYRNTFFINDSFCEWSDEDMAKCEEQKMKIADHYIAHWKEHGEAPIGISAVDKYFGSIYEEREREAQGLPKINLFTNSKCGYGQSAGGAISTNGDIYGCQEMTSNDPLFKIGSIYTGLDDNKRKELADIFDADPVKRGDIPCETCPACSVCNGGCIANNYMQTGKFNTCSHAYCESERQTYRIACYIIDQLKDCEAFQQFASNKTRNGGSRAPKKNCGVCQNQNQTLNTTNTNNANQQSDSMVPPHCGWCQECQTYLRFQNNENATVTSSAPKTATTATSYTTTNNPRIATPSNSNGCNCGNDKKCNGCGSN